MAEHVYSIEEIRKIVREIAELYGVIRRLIVTNQTEQDLSDIVFRFTVSPEFALPCEQTVAFLPRKLRKIKEWPLVDMKNGPAYWIKFGTIRSFKGLEADVAFLIGIRSGSKVCTTADVYVGASRAKFLLFVFTTAIGSQRTPLRNKW